MKASKSTAARWERSWKGSFQNSLILAAHPYNSLPLKFQDEIIIKKRPTCQKKKKKKKKKKEKKKRKKERRKETVWTNLQINQFGEFPRLCLTSTIKTRHPQCDKALRHFFALNSSPMQYVTATARASPKLHLNCGQPNLCQTRGCLEVTPAGPRLGTGW